MIAAIQRWFADKSTELRGLGVHASLSAATTGLAKNRISMDLKVGHRECTVELWESGEMSVVLANMETSEVSVRSIEVSTQEALIKVLESLITELTMYKGETAA